MYVVHGERNVGGGRSVVVVVVIAQREQDVDQIHVVGVDFGGVLPPAMLSYDFLEQSVELQSDLPGSAVQATQPIDPAQPGEVVAHRE